jgi:hypothetical protein
MTTTHENPFHGVPRNAEGHFRLFAYGAVLRIVNYVRVTTKLDGRTIDSRFKPFPFLAVYFEELRACLPEEKGWGESLEWWHEQVVKWESECGGRLPLREAAKHAGLSHSDQTLLVMIGLVEEDIRFGSLFATLQEPLSSRRPCLGLLGALMSGEARLDAITDPWAAIQKLLAAGLVLAENQSAPRAEWILRVPPPLWDAIRGRAISKISPACRIQSRRAFPPLKNLVLDDSLRRQLTALPAGLSGGQISALVLRGMTGSGRRTIMGSLARAMRRDVLHYERKITAGPEDDVWGMIGPLSALAGAFPVISVDAGPSEAVELHPLTGYKGPVGVILKREGGVKGPLLERAVAANVPSPVAEERLDLWKRTLKDGFSEELERVARSYLLPLGHVHRAAIAAGSYAALDRRTIISPGDIQLACRSLNREALDIHSQRLEATGDWSDLVMNEPLSSDLLDLERRCRHRERLLANLGVGFRNSINCGVRALFNGPSGTGKTLAAKILASVLCMDVYRVDLASVVNKYIGETEKNLSHLLARAEELDVLLLIDEGDALMSNRTEVKSANDRYANLETNYLLQRLESYQGIVIVTTNAGTRIDHAFQRRFDMVVGFHPPDPFERVLIWQRHLPPLHRVSDSCVQQISHQCAMTGGQIRNAALYAALLAVDADRDGEVSDYDLERAVQAEYRKAGGTCPVHATSEVRGHSTALSQFLGEVS